jgi:cytochrome P450
MLVILSDLFFIIALIDHENYILHNGVTIYPNDQILTYTEGLMNDPKIFNNPSEYNPCRWLETNVNKTQLEQMNSVFYSFGGGARICPGMHLAYAESELGLAYILKYFDVELQCDRKDVKRIQSFTARADRMPMKFLKRK